MQIFRVMLQPPQAHEGFVPAYQQSALPYVTSSILLATGSIHSYTFDYVTRFFTVKNTGGTDGDTINVAFTSNGFESGNSFSLGRGETFDEEIRCVKLFVSCSAGAAVNYELIAGLTNIPFKNFNVLTGSTGWNGVG